LASGISNSSRIRPSTISANAFWVGLPSAMSRQTTPWPWARIGSADAVNSVRVSLTKTPGQSPRASLFGPVSAAGIVVTKTEIRARRG
jgi:hypothetical protein